MNANFVASMIRSGSSGYAGVATSLLLERVPDLEGRFGGEAFQRWKDNLEQRLLELSAALEADAPGAFAARMRWNAQAFAVRDISADDLRAAMGALGDVLRENMPQSATATLDFYLDEAAEAISEPGNPPDTVLNPEDPADRLVLEYLSSALEGRPQEAIALAVKAAEGEGGVRSAYLQVLRRAQQEIGRLWFANQASIFEEHLVTQTTERATAALAALAPRGPQAEKTIVIASVETNAHDLGARFVADFFEMEGWRTVFLGADTPAEDIAEAATQYNADVVALSATLVTQLNRVARAISVVREGRPDVKVLVGGRAFEDAEDAWERFGADGYPTSAEEAVRQAAALTAP